MVKPNFVIVGAAKAGTTSLRYYLAQHPAIFMSDSKEPEYFAYKDTGAEFSGPGDKEAHGLVVSRAEDYDRLFANARSDQIAGEASTIYLYNHAAARNMAEFNPEMKIIAVLRNPTDRAWSHFVYLMNQLARWGVKDYERYANFRDCVEQEAARIKANWGPDWHFCERGRYLEQLRRIFECFPRKQVKVFLYDDLKRDALGVVKEIIRFLGVDDRFEPDVATRLNVARQKGIPRETFLHRVSGALRVRSFMGVPIARWVPRRLKESAHGAMYFSPAFEPDLRKELVSGFSGETLTVEQLIERDLTMWRE